jgi:hypothetical protein
LVEPGVQESSLYCGITEKSNKEENKAREGKKRVSTLVRGKCKGIAMRAGKSLMWMGIQYQLKVN